MTSEVLQRYLFELGSIKCKHIWAAESRKGPYGENLNITISLIIGTAGEMVIS